MVVLHFGAITGNRFNGVCVVVPQYIVNQQSLITVGLVNLRDYQVEGVEHQFSYSEGFCLSDLPEPFCAPDLVVFQEAYRTPYLAISKELRKRKIPYVIIPHGELNREAQKKKWIKKKVANLLLFNRFIKGAVGIQCLSDREMEMTKMGKERFIGTNGIYIPELQKKDFHKDTLDFLYIGRLDAYHKGLDLLIRAASLCADTLRSNRATISIYGPDYAGRYAAVEQMIAENNVGDVVKLHPPIVGEEKEARLMEADVFIQTSRFEGMPMGILEALSYGLPCLVTEGTTVGELIERSNAGWRCDTEAESIAQCFCRVIEQRELLQEKSNSARACAKEHFAWDIITQNTLAQYEQKVMKRS